MTEGARWTVAQAGRAAGVTRKAIRVYEARGLISPAERTAAGHRLFSDVAVDTLRFVRRARTLGLGLDDIADVLAEHRRGSAPCASVRARLNDRVREIDRAIAELRELRRSLAEVNREYPRAAGDAICPIIEKLADGGAG